MGIKLIALDLDGTTLNDKGEFSYATQNAFKEAKKQGVHIVIATGRSYYSLPKQTHTIEEIEYAATSNGAEIRTIENGNCIYKNCISSESIEEIYQIIREHNLMIEAFTNGKAYMTEKEFIDTINGKYDFRKIEYVKETRNPVEDVVEFLIERKEEIENINFFFKNDKDKKYYEKILSDVSNTTLTSSQICNLEIGGATTSKASAILSLSEILNVDKNHIMAIGDSPNDIELLRAAKYPIAVGNALDEVKEHAIHITDTNDNDGVAKAILKYL